MNVKEARKLYGAALAAAACLVLFAQAADNPSMMVDSAFASDSPPIPRVLQEECRVPSPNSFMPIDRCVRDAAFITTWETTSPNEQIIIWLSGSYIIDWGNGKGATGGTGPIDSWYGEPGIYEVVVYGQIDRFSAHRGTDGSAAKLVSVEQWGDSRWTNLYEAFRGASFKINAADAPDLTRGYYKWTALPSAGGEPTVWTGPDVRRMFSGASFGGNLSHWDVSNVTDMGSMFGGSSFNGDISSWNVSNVRDMGGMFGATPFNQNISGWDVSGVRKMDGMFAGAESFNQNISGWDVSNVRDMSGMFYRAESFNQDISGWDVSGVYLMEEMFYHANSFNQDISSWNVSSVTDMSGMFVGATSFNQPLDTWDVSSFTNMGNMFYGASSFNQNISAWDVSQVRSMYGMFGGATSFNQPLNNWDVSSVVQMGKMFYGAESFNQPLNNWDVSSVTNMDGMFYGAESFNQPLDNWDVSSVVQMGEMFYGAESFNQPLGTWDVSSVVQMGEMFGAESSDRDLGIWLIILDDQVVTDSDPVVGRISSLSRSTDGQRYSIVHPDDGTFRIDPGRPRMATDRIPYYEAGGHIPLYGATLVLNPDHNLEPGIYNVTISRYTGNSNWHLGDFSPPWPWRDGGTTPNWHGGTLSWPSSANHTRTIEVLYDGLTLNRPPVAYATLIQSGQAGQLVTLNGTGSWDPDGEDHLAYKWRQTGGPVNVTLSDGASPTPTFTAPYVPSMQAFKFELVVSDGRVDSQPYTSTILVTPTTGP